MAIRSATPPSLFAPDELRANIELNSDSIQRRNRCPADEIQRPASNKMELQHRHQRHHFCTIHRRTVVSHGLAGVEHRPAEISLAPQETKTVDVETFDKASRGPEGCLELLCKHRGL
jgi:hypothetical protein